MAMLIGERYVEGVMVCQVWSSGLAWLASHYCRIDIIILFIVVLLSSLSFLSVLSAVFTRPA